MFQRPQVFTARVISNKSTSPKVTKLTLKTLNPPQIIFVSGQFVNILCPNGSYRAYSIASDPQVTDQIDILVETGHEGVAANFIRSLKINKELQFIGPSGTFHLQANLSDHLVFFATGTGIAPFLSMFYKLISINYAGQVDLYSGIRTEANFLEKDFLNLVKSKLNFNLQVFVSKPDGPLSPNNTKGHVTDVLTDTFDYSAQFYICGHPSMVEEVSEKLLSHGVSPLNMIKEGFTYSKSANLK